MIIKLFLGSALLLTLAWSQTDLSQPQADDVFEGGSNSLAAVAIGAAEGTRTPEGEKTQHWDQHIDPGNGVTNQGTFSYQHGAATPEAADQKQLDKLKDQASIIQSEAQKEGIKLGVLGLVSGLDAFNQSEAAGADFVTNLNTCGGEVDLETIVCARASSYYENGVLDAPGLGNDPANVTADQRRRTVSIQSAINLAQ